jgi:hypothetical protein
MPPSAMKAATNASMAAKLAMLFGAGGDGFRSRSILVVCLAAGQTMLTTVIPPIAARAEEGGSRHYQPGGSASFIDMLTGQEGFAYANVSLRYNGSSGTSEPLEFGGRVDTNVSATSVSNTSALLYQTAWTLLGGQYAAGIVVPYVWSDVTARTNGGGVSRRIHDSADGVGDIQILPVMFGWTRGELKWQAQLGIYTPTGGFQTGRLANIGKNYWTFEPAAAISYVGETSGLEATLFAGIDFNTRNDAIGYQTGDQVHLDATVAQHLPLFGGIAGIGAATFYYRQISGDSGSGALLGSQEARTIGLGPTISYVAKAGHASIVAELKWLHELEADHRLKGDAVWCKLGATF